MDETRELSKEAVGTPSQRRPYVKPELRMLGDVLELTRAASGSFADGMKGKGQSSSIRFKTDVSYLSAAERKAIVDQVLQLQLANWTYLDGVEDGGRHLGVIVEDAPDMPAVTADKKAIDLYTYASMAIAAAQVHAAELAGLRSEVAKLRDEIERLRNPS